MNMHRKSYYCKFYRKDCIMDQCPAFEIRHPMSVMQLQRAAASDVPISEPYIRNWCTKYETCVTPIIVVEG